LTPLETAVLGGDAHDISLLARHGGTAALKIADRFCQALSDEPRFCIVLDGRERLEPDRSMRDRKNR